MIAVYVKNYRYAFPPQCCAHASRIVFIQETYGKLLDSCVLSISRLDQGTWIRRGTKDSLAMNGRESPLHRGGTQNLCVWNHWLNYNSRFWCETGWKNRCITARNPKTNLGARVCWPSMEFNVFDFILTETDWPLGRSYNTSLRTPYKACANFWWITIRY